VETLEVQWSDLARDPKRVAALADDGIVRVRRRDGGDLLLTREDRAEVTEEGVLNAARALNRALAQLTSSQVRTALGDVFPWLDVLPPDDLSQFATEFVRAVQVSAELGVWLLLGQTITEWKATAAVHADPELHRLLTVPVDGDHGPVPGPGSC